MNILHRLVRLIVLVVLLVAGMFIISVALIPNLRSAVMCVMETDPIYVVYAGLAVVVLGLLFAVTGTQRKQKGKFLSFQNDSGTVSISTDAIADYIMKLMDEFPSVTRMRPVVLPERHAIDIAVSIRIKAGPQISEICELLQQRIRESLTNGLGISAVGRVAVSVTDIVAEKNAA